VVTRFEADPAMNDSSDNLYNLGVADDRVSMDEDAEFDHSNINDVSGNAW